MENTLLILPRYCSYLHEASHMLHIALDIASATPMTPKEDFEEMIKIYEELGDLVKKIEDQSI